MSAANRFELRSSAAASAGGSSGTIKVPTFSMLMVGVDVTVHTGAVGDLLAVWLQGSDDGGATWYDIATDQRQKTTIAGGEIDADLNKRNVADSSVTAGSIRGDEADTEIAAGRTLKVVGIFKHLPSDTIRVQWTVSAGSFTFSVGAVGK